MNIRIILLLSAFAAFFLPFAYGENNPAPAAAQVAAAPHRGTLYRVRHRDHTAYLFGTIHVGSPAFFPLEEQVTRALSEATRLVLELDVRQSEPFQAALQKHGVYADGTTMDRHLSADSLKKLQQALTNAELPYEQVARMKPWLVMNLLMALDLERNGYRRQDGVEFFLLSQAQAAAVQELESAEYQMSLYDGMSEAEQEQYLVENLAQLGDGELRKKTLALLDAWAGADSNTLESLLRESLAEQTVSAEFTRKILLDKRNPEMAEKIEALLKDDGTSFVGVGMLHLLGDGGLPALLKQRGYAVEKLY